MLLDFTSQFICYLKYIFYYNCPVLPPFSKIYLSEEKWSDWAAGLKYLPKVYKKFWQIYHTFEKFLTAGEMG